MALHPLGAVDPTGLIDARLQLHHAAQFVAAFGQNVLEARDDDSHRAMSWKADAGRFSSHEGPSGLCAWVSPEPFSIGLAREGEELASLRLMGTTLRTAQAWMTKSISEATDDPDFELTWPEYDLPEHFVREGRPFQAKPGSMNELARWFSGAAVRLSRLASSEPGASPILVWPHHFDIATLIVLTEDDDGAPTGTVGVGMSPGDGGIHEPYWYVNAWGYPEAAAFPEIQAPGYTHREGWMGFVLTGTQLIEAGREGRADPVGEGERQAEALEAFLDRAVTAAKALFAV